MSFETALISIMSVTAGILARPLIDYILDIIVKPPVLDIRGAWNSSWGPLPDGPLIQDEIVRITKQRGHHVSGNATRDSEPGKEWILEGRFDGQFLQLYYYPKDASPNFIDYGCYFFVKNPDGRFIGHSSGFGNYIPDEYPETSTDYHELRWRG